MNPPPPSKNAYTPPGYSLSTYPPLTTSTFQIRANSQAPPPIPFVHSTGTAPPTFASLGSNSSDSPIAMTSIPHPSSSQRMGNYAAVNPNVVATPTAVNNNTVSSNSYPLASSSIVSLQNISQSPQNLVGAPLGTGTFSVGPNNNNSSSAAPGAINSSSMSF